MAEPRPTREGYYPRKGNMRVPLVYSTLDRFGDPKHTLYGGKLDMGGCRTGAGTWWPDFGPTTRDFSPGGINHPTSFVFASEVEPFTQATRSQSEPRLLPPKEPAFPQQFRHPRPATEALMKSVDVMPYKTAGRRKCGEASNWRAALSSGCEGRTHGGRTPIFCKGPLLDNPDFHQLHPLKRDEATVNISNACVAEKLAAGTATGTCPVDALLLSSKTTKSLGLRDCDTIRSEMTVNRHANTPHSQTFKAASTRLNGNAESFQKSFRGMPKSFEANVRSMPELGDGSPSRSVTFDASVSSVCSDAGADKLPNWIATRTVASRDAGAAGGQAGPTSIRRIPLTRAS